VLGGPRVGAFVLPVKSSTVCVSRCSGSEICRRTRAETKKAAAIEADSTPATTSSFSHSRWFNGVTSLLMYTVPMVAPCASTGATMATSCASTIGPGGGAMAGTARTSPLRV
jgi:hypothetical protein